MPDSWVDAQLVWGLVPRFVGVLYVIAFTSLIPQLEAGVGSQGIVPIAVRLAHTRRHFSAPRCFLQTPTLFWLSSSDVFIRCVPWLGAALGALVVYGGPWAGVALVLAWMLWLSLEPAGLIFPWDTMLQEAG